MRTGCFGIERDVGFIYTGKGEKWFYDVDTGEYLEDPDEPLKTALMDGLGVWLWRQ